MVESWTLQKNQCVFGTIEQWTVNTTKILIQRILFSRFLKSLNLVDMADQNFENVVINLKFFWLKHANL